MEKNLREKFSLRFALPFGSLRPLPLALRLALLSALRLCGRLSVGGSALPLALPSVKKNEKKLMQNEGVRVHPLTPFAFEKNLCEKNLCSL